MGVGDLVLSVVVIPDVHPSVSSGEEEDSWSGWGEASIGEIGSVVLGSDDGDLEIILPDFGTPVSDGQEVLGILEGSLDRVDGSEMFSTFDSVSSSDFNILFGSFVSIEDSSLFSSDQEFGRSCFSIIFDDSTSDKGPFRGFSDFELINWSLIEISHIPLEDSSIGGGSYAFGITLTGNPEELGDGVIM